MSRITNETANRLKIVNQDSDLSYPNWILETIKGLTHEPSCILDPGGRYLSLNLEQIDELIKDLQKMKEFLEK